MREKTTIAKMFYIPYEEDVILVCLTIGSDEVIIDASLGDWNYIRKIGISEYTYNNIHKLVINAITNKENNKCKIKI
jgi:hypothetical protein